MSLFIQRHAASDDKKPWATKVVRTSQGAKTVEKRQNWPPLTRLFWVTLRAVKRDLLPFSLAAKHSTLNWPPALLNIAWVTAHSIHSVSLPLHFPPLHRTAPYCLVVHPITAHITAHHCTAPDCTSPCWAVQCTSVHLAHKPHFTVPDVHHVIRMFPMQGCNWPISLSYSCILVYRQNYHVTPLNFTLFHSFILYCTQLTHDAVTLLHFTVTLVRKLAEDCNWPIFPSHYYWPVAALSSLYVRGVLLSGKCQPSSVFSN